MGTKVAVAFANIFMVKVETFINYIKQKRKKANLLEMVNTDQTTSSLSEIPEANNL